MIKKYGQLLTGLINQFVNILSPFIITVIGLKTTDAEHGSIWVIFLSMMVLINLFDFGLSPTTIRNISYVIGGAKTLQKDGIVAISDDAIISFPLLLRLLKDIKRIYSYITIVAFFIITLGGGIYFWLISPEHLATEIIIAWVFFFSRAFAQSLLFILHACSVWLRCNSTFLLCKHCRQIVLAYIDNARFVFPFKHNWFFSCLCHFNIY